MIVTESVYKNYENALKNCKNVENFVENGDFLIIYTNFLLTATDDFVTLYLRRDGDDVILTDLKTLSDFYEYTMEENIENLAEIVKKSSLEYVNFETFCSVTPENIAKKLDIFKKMLKNADLI